MIVDINLLPKKEKKDISWLVVFVIILLLLLAAIVSFRQLYQLQQREVAALRTEWMNTQFISEQLSQQLDEEVKSANEQLREIITVVEGQLLPTTVILDHLVSQLPERGFFQSFDFFFPNEVKIVVQFDQWQEVAQFQHSLTASPLFQEVNLLSITTDEWDVNEGEKGSYLPRYTASMLLAVNRQVLKEMGDMEQ